MTLELASAAEDTLVSTRTNLICPLLGSNTTSTAPDGNPIRQFRIASAPGKPSRPGNHHILDDGFFARFAHHRQDMGPIVGGLRRLSRRALQRRRFDDIHHGSKQLPVVAVDLYHLIVGEPNRSDAVEPVLPTKEVTAPNQDRFDAV